MTKKYLAIIPARGGSKRILRKNLSLLAGKPLLAYTIEAAQKSLKLTGIIVSTEDPEIAETAKNYGAMVFLRPDELAADQSSLLAVINNVLDHLGPEVADLNGVVLLQPTAPFRTGKHIDEAIELFEKSAANTVTAVSPANEHPFYAWTLIGGELVPFFSIKHQIMTRNELPPAFFENGSIYVLDKMMLSLGEFYGEKIIPYQMGPLISVDIDTPMDLLWAEFLIKYHNKQLEKTNG